MRSVSGLVSELLTFALVAVSPLHLKGAQTAPSASVYLSLANRLLEKEEYAKAVDPYKTALAIEPSIGTYFGLSLDPEIANPSPDTIAPQDSMATRFGELEIDKSGILLFNRTPISPRIQANSRLGIGKPFQIGEADVALITDEGGTACPVQYYFVTVTNSGARATKAFGTCNELTSTQRKAGTITVTMRGYLGPFERPAQRRRASEQRHTFVFENGVVTESGEKCARSQGANRKGQQ
jgi:hypothetical protein